MPTYQYRCSQCNYEFEEFQSINDEPLVKCPSCTEPQLKRLLSGGTGLIFKGSGFYLTDYKKSNSSQQQNSSSSQPQESTKHSTKTEVSTSTSSSLEKSTV
ncbi:MAG: zinc ribbon domain-containing protein [Bacteroidetes bacterium]|nr:zinc ribbon domain-containing protein [Bacteroidota bacterium]